MAAPLDLDPALPWRRSALFPHPVDEDERGRRLQGVLLQAVTCAATRRVRGPWPRRCVGTYRAGMPPYGVSNIRQEVPLRGRATSPEEVCRAFAANGGAQLFLPRLRHRTLHRREAHSLALLTDVPLDSAWQAPPVDNLPRVIQGAAVMELLGMAHQDIPP